MPNPIEFLYFLNQQKKYPSYYPMINPNEGLDLNTSKQLFTFEKLFGAQVLQYVLLYYQNNDSKEFKKLLNLDTMYLPVFNFYIKFLFLNITLKNFVMVKSVKDIILGYKDPLLYSLKNQKTYLGGDPSLPEQVFIFQNQTLEQNYFPQQIYSGYSDLKKSGFYKTVNGSQYIRYYQQSFNGNETYDVLLNPYQVDERVKGSDSTHNPYDLKTNEHAFTYISDFNAESQYKGQNIYYGKLMTYRYTNIPNIQPKDEKYHRKYNKITNLTLIKRSPLVVIGFNGYDKDPNISNLYIYDTNGTQIYPSEEFADYQDIEPNSGITINAKLQITICYDYYGDFIFQNGNEQLIPFVGLQRYGQWNQNAIDEQFKDLYLANILKIMLPILFTLISIIIFTLVLLKYLKNRKMDKFISFRDSYPNLMDNQQMHSDYR